MPAAAVTSSNVPSPLLRSSWLRLTPATKIDVAVVVVVAGGGAGRVSIAAHACRSVTSANRSPPRFRNSRFQSLGDCLFEATAAARRW